MMIRTVVWLAVLCFGGAALDAVVAADLGVRVDARQIAARRVHTDLTLQVKPGPLTLVFAKWIPGEHTPTGPLESLIGLEIRANGARLAWSRDPLDMYALRVTVPRGVTALDISMESGLAVDGEGFSSAPTSSAELAVVSWNQFLLFPKGVDAERISAHAMLVPPAGWTTVSALPSTPAADGARDYGSASVARLIDSPVQMGRHARLVELTGSVPRADLPHALSIMADSAEALTVPDDFAQGYDRLVAECGALFGSRMYGHYTWLLSLSDHVAHFGLEHHESSDNRTEENAFAGPESRMEVAGLLGHEYVHSWNGKYRRPRGLLSPDYQKPMDGSLLWSYEGMTQFWGEVLPTRAGLISAEYFRDSLAARAASLETGTGPRWRPMADTAVAAQILYNAPASFSSSRRGVDYYDASIYLWLDVDAELRTRTAGRASLDDYVGRFYAGQSGSPSVSPYDEQDIYDTLASLAPGDWRAFVHRHLDPPDVTALRGALERSGWRLDYTAETNPAIEEAQKYSKQTDRLYSLGLSLDKDAKIVDVIGDRAAAIAGASPGMTVIAVNGKKFTVARLDAAIVAAQATHAPIALLVENSEDLTTLAVAYFDGPRYPHLVRLAERPDMLSAVIAPRTR
jgi:predicted metalloprotease with PDZ domain